MSLSIGDEQAGFRSFQEILLLLRFIYRSICDRRQGCKRGRAFCDRFYDESRLVQSFARSFLQVDGRLDESIKTEPWFKNVGDAVERLRRGHFGDYAKLALVRDRQYLRLSPFANTSKAGEKEIEFLWNSDDEPTYHTWGLERDSSNLNVPSERNSNGSKAVDKLCDPQVEMLSNSWIQGFDEKLGLWEDRRLEKLLRRTRLCTSSLLLWVPLIMATHPRYQDPSAKQSCMSKEDAFRLNANSHLCIRSITNGDVPNRPTMMLREFKLRVSKESAGLIPGELVDMSNKESEPVLVEYKQHRRSNDPDRPIRGEFELIQLSYLLEAASTQGSDLHTLDFKGIIDQSASRRRFAFIFRYPKLADIRQPPLSLHTIIRNASLKNGVSLPIRFQIAQTLSKTLAKFHADGWVHKNISSHAVMFFTSSSSHTIQQYEKPYLVDFEYARPVGAETEYTSEDPCLESNLYRHPKRQGLPSEAFIKMHDIYALGVVLLEIGLWKPVRQIYEEACPESAPLRDEILDPWKIQRALLKSAEERLINAMGMAYTEAVVSCMGDFFRGLSFQKELGAIFMEQVVGNLEISKLIL